MASCVNYISIQHSKSCIFATVSVRMVFIITRIPPRLQAWRLHGTVSRTKWKEVCGCGGGVNFFLSFLLKVKRNKTFPDTSGRLPVIQLGVMSPLKIRRLSLLYSWPSKGFPSSWERKPSWFSTIHCRVEISPCPSPDCSARPVSSSDLNWDLARPGLPRDPLYPQLWHRRLSCLEGCVS